MASRHWIEAVRDAEQRGEAYAIVTVLGARGSTPRDSGTKMVVESASFEGTIGGGELEYRALARARAMLADGESGQWVENYPLGEKLGQCCGGSTSLLYECFVPTPLPVFLFGAGHVGRALAPILAALPLQLRWVDERRDAFPGAIPAGVRVEHERDPVDLVRTAAAGSYFVIMTHNHPLDYALVEAALARRDAAFVGVIGSASKARRFRMRLAHRGFDEAGIAALHCPIGLPGVPGKEPAEIAVAVAAQVIAAYHARRDVSRRARGPSWKRLQLLLTDARADQGIPVTDRQP